MKSGFPPDVRGCELMGPGPRVFYFNPASPTPPHPHHLHWGTDGRWRRGCHSYHLTYNPVQTEVDVDTLQTPVKQSSAAAATFYTSDPSSSSLDVASSSHFKEFFFSSFFF